MGMEYIATFKAVIGGEVCSLLLLLCCLCCWPDDGKSEKGDKDKGHHPKKIVVRTTTNSGSGAKRRLGESLRRHFGSSATSLHLPSTSGVSKQQISAHRSHEEIPQPRKSHLETKPDEDTRYHSAPSVIHEIVHRRDWERSNTHLHIPLKANHPQGEEEPFIQEVLNRRNWSSTHLYIPLKSPSDIDVFKDSEDSLRCADPPYADAESSSIELYKSDEKITCKKHHTNIKSSKNKIKKETNGDDEKDTDATETSNNTRFYIGDGKQDEPDNSIVQNVNSNIFKDDQIDALKVKEAKQSLNESIKSKEHSKSLCGSQADHDEVSMGLERKVVQLQQHFWINMYRKKTYDIDLDLCVDEIDRSGAIHPSPEFRKSLQNSAPECPTPAPSVESDLEFELDGCNERPPSYEEATETPKHKVKETAI